jgi:hypothetical protein
VLSSSPDRGSFQKESYLKGCETDGKIPDPAYLDMFKSWREQKLLDEQNPAWQKDNLEFDLRNTKWICDKVKASTSYAQNLYAAMCNMEFIRLDPLVILKDQRWGVSWRGAGGIVADMREKGDYIDWYCSGIRDADTDDYIRGGYVGEGCVTDEIREDLKKLGWVAVEINDTE